MNFTPDIELSGLIERRDWPDGPWNDEPDLVIWRDAETEYLCAVVRVPRLGHLCGYVGIPESHPAHGLEEYYHELLDDVEVHWGVTHYGESPYIVNCPVTDIAALRFDYVPSWWFGWDAAHSGDAAPSAATCEIYKRCQYREFDYAVCETVSLARGLYQIGGKK